MKLAKANLVPTAANLLGEYASFTALEAACSAFSEQVNARPHRVTRRAPAEMLGDERAHLHPVPCLHAHPDDRRRPARATRCLRWCSFEGGRHRRCRRRARGAGRARPPARGTGRHRPRRPARPGRGGSPPRHVAGQPAPGGGALPACPARGAEPPANPQRGRGGVPRHRAGRRPVAGRGRRGRSLPGPVQDGPGRRARRPAADGPVDRALGQAAAARRFADSDLSSVLAHQASAAPGEPSRAGESPPTPRAPAAGLPATAGREKARDRRAARAARGRAAQDAAFVRQALAAAAMDFAQAKDARGRATRPSRKQRSPSRTAPRCAKSSCDACPAVDYIDFRCPSGAGGGRRRPGPAAPGRGAGAAAAPHAAAHMRRIAPEVIATAGPSAATSRGPAGPARGRSQGRDGSSLATRRARRAFRPGSSLKPGTSACPRSRPHPVRPADTGMNGRHDLVICGPSGTGERSCRGPRPGRRRRRKNVTWSTLEQLGRLLRRHRDDSVTKAISRVLRADLVVVDDIGLLPVSPDAAEGLSASSTPPTGPQRRGRSNLHPSGFDELMPKTLATATVVRLMHHAHVCQTSGDGSASPRPSPEKE